MAVPQGGFFHTRATGGSAAHQPDKEKTGFQYPNALPHIRHECPLWVKTRRTGASPGRSAPGGEADEIGGEADIAA